MEIDIGVLIAVLGLAISCGAFLIGRASANKKEGEVAGELQSDVKHIKTQVDKIDSKLDKEVERLGGQIDAEHKLITDAFTKATQAHECAKSAHKRIDEHLDREHDQPQKPHYRTE